MDRDNDEVPILFELNRKWRRHNERRVVGTFAATNLSVTIIFPEDTFVIGTMSMHILKSDFWMYELLIYIFDVVVFGFIFGLLLLLLVLACVRFYLIRTG